MKTIIGIDPDSGDTGHGLSIYTEGLLTELMMAPTVYIVKEIFEKWDKETYIVSIENVLASNAIYAKNKFRAKGRDKVAENIMLKVGRCQCAQLELVRWAEYYGITYVLQRPSSNWKDSKSTTFAQKTGWTGRSNADTRSAAYFGYLALDHGKNTSKPQR